MNQALMSTSSFLRINRKVAAWHALVALMVLLAGQAHGSTLETLSSNDLVNKARLLKQTGKTPPLPAAPTPAKPPQTPQNPTSPWLDLSDLATDTENAAPAKPNPQRIINPRLLKAAAKKTAEDNKAETIDLTDLFTEETKPSGTRPKHSSDDTPSDTIQLIDLNPGNQGLQGQTSTTPAPPLSLPAFPQESPEEVRLALEQLHPRQVSIYPEGPPLPLADRPISALIPSASGQMVTTVTGVQSSHINRLPSGTLVNPQTEVNAPDLTPADRQWLARQDRFSIPIRAAPRQVAKVANPNDVVIDRQDTDNPNATPIGASFASATSPISTRQLSAPLQPALEPSSGQPSALPWVYALAYYPQGDRLVTGSSDGLLRVWRLANQQVQGVPIAAHQGWIFAVAVDSAGQTIASAGNDGFIRFFDANTGEPRNTPIQIGGEIFALKFTANGEQLFSSHQDGTIRLWEVKTGRLKGGLVGHEKAVYTLALTQDDKTLASAGADGSVRLWDAVKGKPLARLKADGGIIYGLAFNPSGNVLASTGQDAQVELWSLPSSAAKPYVYYTQGSALLSVAFSPDGRWLIAGSFDHKIWQWPIATGQPVADSPLSGHFGWVNALAFSPDGASFASASADGMVRLWKTDAPLATPSSQAQTPLTPPNLAEPTQALVAVQPLTFNWALAKEGDIHQVAASGNIAVAPVIHASPTRLTALTYSADGKLILSGDQQGAFSVRSAKTGALQSQGQSHTAITALTLSEDGRWLILGHDDGVVQLYYREQALPQVNRKRAKPSTTDIESWSAAPGWSAKPVHQGAVRSLAILPQGLIASGGDDQTLVLQRMDNGEPVGSPFAGHLTAIRALMPAEQGRALYSAGADGSVQKWAVEP